MNGNWLVDIVLFLGVAFLVVLAWQLTKQKAWIDEKNIDEASFDDRTASIANESVKKKFFLYPEKMVRQAGFIPAKIVWLYWAAKFLLAVMMPLALSEMDRPVPFFFYVLGVVLAFFGPDIWLWQRMKKRQLKIQYALSYFLDLTVAFLVSGMSLDSAIRQSVQYGLPPKNPLRQELGLVLREIEAGRERGDAYGALWKRTGVSDVQSLMNVFKVGFHIGSPVVGTLESHSDMLRARLRERGLKRINQKTVLAMIPMILLNFPIMGLLVFFPPLVELAKLFPTLGF